LAKRIEQGEPITLILDSTGLRFGKASHWYQTKYGKPCDQRPWRKLHLSMDLETEIHDVEITETEVADIDMMKDLIPKKSLLMGAIIARRMLRNFIIKALFRLFLPPLMLWYKEKPTLCGMTRLFNISKIKEPFMLFIKNMVMA